MSEPSNVDWPQARDIVYRALELPVTERDEFVRGSTGSVPGLTQYVLELLQIAAGEDDPVPVGASAPDFVDEAFRRPASMGPVIGDRVGAYRLIRQIGEGGMGSVFLAERADDTFEHQVAIKLGRDRIGGQCNRDRFRLEEQILGGLVHPGIARLYDAGFTGEGHPYFVMEYVDGMPITQFCNENALDVDERLALFIQVCEAVSYAQQHLVVHRDLKPGNILVGTDGRVKLLDFGIARIVDSESDKQSAPGGFLTPSHAAPEQLAGENPTTAMDVYSLGVVLHEILTGQLPSTEEHVSTTINKDSPAPPNAAVGAGGPRHLRPNGFRRDIGAILHKSLRKEPSERYASSAGLQADLQRYLNGRPVLARRRTLSYRLAKFGSRYALSLTVAAAAIALLSSVLVVSTLRIRSERDSAKLAAVESEETTQLMVDLFSTIDPMRDIPSHMGTMTVDRFLEISATRIRGRLNSQPKARLVLLGALGSAFAGLGSFRQADELLTEAMELPDNAPVNAAQLARVMTELGYTRGRLGNMASADSLLRGAIALAQDDFPIKLRARARLAGLYLLGADSDSVWSILAPAFGQSVNNLPPDHAAVLDATVVMARMLLASRRPNDAEAILHRALRLGQRNDEINPLLLAMIKSHIGNIVRQRDGRYPESVAWLAEAVDEARDFGAAAPILGDMIGKLAHAQVHRGQMDEAQASSDESIRLLRSTFGRDHVRTGLALLDYEHVQTDLGRHQEASEALEDALEIFTASVGSQHEYTQEARRRLVDAKQKSGHTKDLVSLGAGRREITFSIDVNSLSKNGLFNDDDVLLINGSEPPLSWMMPYERLFDGDGDRVFKRTLDFYLYPWQNEIIYQFVICQSGKYCTFDTTGHPPLIREEVGRVFEPFSAQHPEIAYWSEEVEGAERVPGTWTISVDASGQVLSSRRPMSVGVRGTSSPLSTLRTVELFDPDADGIFSRDLSLYLPPGTRIEFWYVVHEAGNPATPEWTRGSLPKARPGEVIRAEEFPVRSGVFRGDSLLPIHTWRKRPSELRSDVKEGIVRFELDARHAMRAGELSQGDRIGVRGSGGKFDLDRFFAGGGGILGGELPLSVAESFMLSDTDGDSIYTGQMPVRLAPGDRVNYKYVIEREGETVWEMAPSLYLWRRFVFRADATLRDTWDDVREASF